MKTQCAAQNAVYEEQLDWLRRKGRTKGAGKGGKGSSCAWCGLPRHFKKDCKAFQKWKEDKDAERAKKGLPQYVPPAPGTRRNAGPGTGPNTPTALFDLDYEVEPGGMTLDADSLERESDVVLCGVCDCEFDRPLRRLWMKHAFGGSHGVRR